MALFCSFALDLIKCCIVISTHMTYDLKSLRMRSDSSELANYRNQYIYERLYVDVLHAV